MIRNQFKLILLGLVTTASFLAMDNQPSNGYLQAEQESHPAKNEIAQAIAQTQIMPDVLAPLIAAYAENPYKGYMFIVPNKGHKISQCPPGGLEYIQEEWPHLRKDLTRDSVMVQIWVSSQQSVLDGSSTYLWHAGNCPSSDLASNFPWVFPAMILKKLKEDDSLFITIKEIPFELKCSQLTHRFRYDNEKRLCPFEKALAQATQGLVETSNESIYEDQE